MGDNRISMGRSMSTIKDGDIFRWRYKDEKPEHRREWGRYHCKSQIAVAKNGILIDTYWDGSPPSNSGVWTYEMAERDLALKLIGNFADLEQRPEYHAAYYDDADIVNLNHPNSSRDNFYIRKGAQRSRDKMLAVLDERIADKARTIESAKNSLDRFAGMKADILSGKPLDEVHL